MISSLALQLFWELLSIVGIGFLFLMVFVYFFQSRLVYFPSDQRFLTPREMGIDYQDVSFYSEDKVELHGWWVPASEGSKTILFCHGNAGNITHRVDSIRLFYELGWSVFIFDYRGYGKSAGSPCEEGTYRDGEAAWKYLEKERNRSSEDIVIFGRSLGGAIAARLARDFHPAGLILESTFTSLPELGKKIYPFLPVSWLARLEYPTLEYVKKTTCPICIFHSREDEIIPFSLGQKLWEEAPNGEDFVEINGSHNNGFVTSRKRYREGMENFLEKISQKKGAS